MDDLARFCCLNPDCKDHGRRSEELTSASTAAVRRKQYRM